jgi:hypothetical protein
MTYMWVHVCVWVYEGLCVCLKPSSTSGLDQNLTEEIEWEQEIWWCWVSPRHKIRIGAFWLSPPSPGGHWVAEGMIYCWSSWTPVPCTSSPLFPTVITGRYFYSQKSSPGQMGWTTWQEQVPVKIWTHGMAADLQSPHLFTLFLHFSPFATEFVVRTTQNIPRGQGGDDGLTVPVSPMQSLALLPPTLLFSFLLPFPVRIPTEAYRNLTPQSLAPSSRCSPGFPLQLSLSLNSWPNVWKWLLSVTSHIKWKY